MAQEYAAGGELFERIIEAGRLPEAEARFFFQQLISGIAYCHKEARHTALLEPFLPGAAAANMECSSIVQLLICNVQRLRCACPAHGQDLNRSCA